MGASLRDRAATPSEPSQAVVSGKAGIPSAEMMELYANPLARTAVARCIELIREQREDYLSEEYCSDQPMCSFAERFVLGQMAVTLENEFALGTMEQCSLLRKPSPFDLYRQQSASAIEARSDVTGTGTAEGESVVGNAETPKVGQP